MNIELCMSGRKNAYKAFGLYIGNSFIVKTGSKISSKALKSQKCGKAAKLYHDSDDYINKDGYLIKDCKFKSPSTAAEFVCGYSINGFLCWKTNDNKSLKTYLQTKEGANG